MITANLATFSPRADAVQKAVASIAPQVDLVRVYANDYTPEFTQDNVVVITGEDLTDNGKFFPLIGLTEDEYYFTCDDDIIYPPDYVEHTMKYLKKYDRHFITYHGRRLRGKDISYYHAHDVYSCLRNVEGCWEIDVAGTGVSAFHTSLIRVDCTQWEHMRMSDLMMSLELAKAKIPILCVEHRIFWLQSPRTGTSIYDDEHLKDAIQTSVANQIYELNRA